MGNMSGSYGSHYTLWQSITQNWQSVEGNYTNVTVRMYLTFDGSSYYAYTNNTTYGNMGDLGSYSISSLNYSSGAYKDILLAEWTGNIYHDANGSKYFSVSGYWDTNTSRIGSGSCSAGVWLNQIPRGANFTSFYINNSTLDTVDISYSLDKDVSSMQVSANGGAWQDVSTVSGSWYRNATIRISNLKCNTSYNFRLKANVNGVDTITGYAYATTKDIAKITNVANTDFGQDIDIGFSNLANGTAKLTVKIGETEICSREDLTSTYTLSFTKEELSKMIKLLKDETTEITYVVTTNSIYNATAKSIITLKANIYVKKEGTWIKAKLYKKDSSWKLTKLFFKVAGTWRNTK